MNRLELEEIFKESNLNITICERNGCGFYKLSLNDCIFKDGDSLTLCLIEIEGDFFKLTDKGFMSIRFSYGNGIEPDLSNSPIKNDVGEYFIVVNRDNLIEGIKEFIRVFRN
ncbi:hypothetical protein KY334_02600 [Candidatus Woesearchaeota archaeon]|nr:hypothetical protein [Candidatus Woesearchaeota archaeon]